MLVFTVVIQCVLVYGWRIEIAVEPNPGNRYTAMVWDLRWVLPELRSMEVWPTISYMRIECSDDFSTVRGVWTNVPA